jgi:diguanylate cyclase (GGDEF)-like protein
MPTEHSNKGKFLEDLADETGAAIVVLDKNGNERLTANNNSICAVLYSSTEFGPKCAEDCGTAHSRAVEAGKTIEYHCHAGLDCRASVSRKGGSDLVTIIGRTFTKSADYRNATERAVAGDWRQYPPNTLFENVIISSSPNQLDNVERQLGEVDADFFATLENEPIAVPPKTKQPKGSPPPPVVETKPTPDDSMSASLRNYKLEIETAGDERRPDPFESSLMNFDPRAPGLSQGDDIADREAWRAFIPSLLQVSYKLACRRILEFLARHYGIESSIWLQSDGAEFETAAAFGESENKPMRIDLSVDDKRIRAATRDDSPIVLKELQTGANKKARIIQLFPVVIGGEVRNALGLARDEIDPELSSRILKFCRYVASRLEILRLREAVSDRERRTKIMRDFSDHLRNVDDANFWQRLTNVSAELVGAQRASLLVRGPNEILVAKASMGAPEDIALDTNLGSRVARTILDRGKPVLVMDIAKASLSPAPEQRRYKSSSFISYPITLGGNGVAVMSFTDKTSGGQFDKSDIEALDSIAPQIAVAVDRMTLLDKVDEFAQLSITDPLTGLLNRRYIEERLGEEINRAARSNEPVSFLMIDVDEFKSYNDKFGHPAGDEALRIIGGVLKDALRGADVAARYGGEEFSILLPETNSDEAAVIAERIRLRVDKTPFPERKVTVSIGVATRSEELRTAERLMLAADRAMYRAKDSGRNNFKVYDRNLDERDR